MGDTKTADGLLMTVDAKALHEALARLQAAITRKIKLPILECVLVEVSDETGVSLFSTNMDMQAEEKLTGEAVKVERLGSFCTPLATLYQLAGRMKGEVVCEHDAGGRKLKLMAGRAQAELPTLPAGDFQKIGAMAGEVSFTAAAGAVSAGLSACWHSISTEETRYYLNGVYLERDGNQLVFTSTDGHRLTQLPVTVDGEPLPDFDGVIIPRQACQAFIKLCEASEAGGEVKLSVSDAMVEIAAGHSAFRTKLIDGSYPDYGRVIPKGPFTELVFDVKAMREAVDLVVAASEVKSRSIRLTAQEGRITLRAQGGDLNSQWAEAIVEGDDIAPLDFPLGLNGGYLAAGLAKLGADEGVLRVTGAASPFRLEVEGDDLVQVIMGLRV